MNIFKKSLVTLCLLAGTQSALVSTQALAVEGLSANVAATSN